MKSFQEVLSEAISDLLDSGFDSIERIDRWKRELAEAARRSLISAASLEQELRDALAAIYRKMVEKGGVFKFNPGVDRFTIDKIKPALRGELDRRIMASANLIKLNRDEAISKTLRRFEGWSTSIPPGGVSAEKKSEVKKNVRKSLGSLKFEERRCLIDQGHKLTSAINDLVASDGGAIAGRWRSHYRQAGYKYRPDHKDRDDKVYLIRDSWAHRAGLVKPGRVGYVDDVTAPAQEINCFPSGSRIPFADGVEKAYRRRFDGELSKLITSSGKTLSATPNHPILTPKGWVPIGSLKVGDEVLEASDEHVDVLENHYDGAMPCIADIFDAVSKIGVKSTGDGQLHQFHGDGAEGDVDIVNAAWTLPLGFDAFAQKKLQKFWLTVPDPTNAALRTFSSLIQRCLRIASCIVGSARQAFAACIAFAGHSDSVGIAATSDLPASISDKIDDNLVRHASMLRDSKNAGATIMSGAKRATVVENVRGNYSGHVYNLQTISGWYIANGIFVHNCRCYYIYAFSISELPADMITAKGKAALAAARQQVAATGRTDAATARSAVLPPHPAIGPELLQEAVSADRMGFLRGAKRIEIIPDTDQWHGDTDKGVIRLEAKFEGMAPTDQIHVLMHEIGHAGQDAYPEIFRQFKRKHDARLAYFVDMANATHMADFQRTGKIDGGLADEVFAESYARYCLALPLPAELAAFWRSKMTALMSHREVNYAPWWPVRTSRCQRCSMFEPGIDPMHGRCSAVEGNIALKGHCKLFEIKGARTDAIGDSDPRPAVGYEALRRQLERLKAEV